MSELLDGVRRDLVEWDAPKDVQGLAERVGSDWRTWWHNCHGASLAIVKAEVFEGARVARGWATGVPSQHSWVVVGDPYALVMIFDPTRWSYEREFDGLTIPRRAFGEYRPHGSEGTIWEYGQPRGAAELGEDPIFLDNPSLSYEAETFLSFMEPLGITGWSQLAHAPVQGWPAGEIFEAMYRTRKLSQLVPIDVIGMITDINPSGLYLPGDEKVWKSSASEEKLASPADGVEHG